MFKKTAVDKLLLKLDKRKTVHPDQEFLICLVDLDARVKALERS